MFLRCLTRTHDSPKPILEMSIHRVNKMISDQKRLVLVITYFNVSVSTLNLVNHMKLVFRSLLTLICSVFAFAATASDFEHTWYGYQKFLSSNDTKEWFFQCGSDVQSEFLPLGNFKIQKQNDALILFTVIEHEWRKKEANFGATRIHFSGEIGRAHV